LQTIFNFQFAQYFLEVHKGIFQPNFLFSSPDLKVVWGYCHHLVSVVRKLLHINLLKPLECPLNSLLDSLWWSELHKRNKKPKGVKKGVVCFQSSSLKPPSQFKPNLVEMFIGWSSRKFMFFVDRKYTKETKVSRRELSIFNIFLWNH
jgi:hypothetical protein